MTATLGGRRVAVVGGTGFIGSHLVERLVAESADVLAVARSATRIAHLALVRQECAVALADICSPAELEHAFRLFRPQVVYHLAAHPDGNESLAHVADCVRANGVGLVNVLHASVAAGADVFIYGDSAKDYGNSSVPYRAAQDARPICSYAIVKAAGWQLCTLVSSFTPLQVVALRPTFVYGPRQGRNVITHVRECIAAGRVIRLMGGAQTRDPLYIDDAVDALVAAALSPRAWGHAIPIGGGQELQVSSLCEAVVGALGARVTVASDAQEPRPTEIWRSSSDNADAYRLLGWQPRVTLSEGLQRTIAWWTCGDTPRMSSAATALRRRESCIAATLAPGLTFSLLDRRRGAGSDPAVVPARRRREDRVAAPALVAAGAPLTGADLVDRARWGTL